jgi:CzcA family heavy metal efflux pump
MEWLISLCVRRRGAAVTLSGIALFVAAWGAWNCPLDVFPEFVPSRVTVHTDAPGFTAEQVEQLVTLPLEKAINGAQGVDVLRSESIPGLSVVTVNFLSNANLFDSRQDIYQRIAGATAQLPAGTGTPQLSPLTSSTRALLKIGLISNQVDAYALRDVGDYVIKQRLIALPGVAEVDVFGGSIRQIQIQPDPEKLAAYGFAVSDLVQAAPGTLALKGAGFIDLNGQRVLIQTPTPSPDSSTIGDGILGVRGNTPVRLRDVATITEQPAQRIGDAAIQARPGVLLSVLSQYGANTLTTTRAVENVLLGLVPSLKSQGIALYPALHQPANFIERALSSLERSMAIAAFMIFVVLVLLLRDWRSALISFVSIPFSLLAAIAVLKYFGLTLNTMTLSGFVVSLGVLVDDAVIGIENILRRLRENSQAPSPLPRTHVIRDASLEVHGPVFYATLVVLAVFVPELLSSNVQGRLVGPLALAFMLAVCASFIVALTVTPALSALLLYPEDAHVDPWWIRVLKKLQGLAIVAIHRFVYAGIALVAAAFTVALYFLPSLGGTFLPEFREGHLVVQVESKLPGTSLDEMLALGRRISREVMALPYVATIEQQVGRSENTEDTWGTHQSEFQIELKPDSDIDQGRAEAQIRAILAHYPGIQSAVVTFLGDRISESLTGQTSQVAIKIFGPDLDTLDSTAERVVGALEQVRGIVDLQFKRQSGMPVLGVTLDPSALAAVGLKGQDVLNTIATDYAGTNVGEAYSGPRTVDVVVQLSDRWRHLPEQLSELTINGPFGLVPLSSVAHIVPSSGRYRIQHENGDRLVAVTFNVSGRSLQSVVSEVRDRIGRDVTVDPGVRIDVTGAAAAEQETRVQLAAYSALVLAAVMLILFSGFRWGANPWLVMVNIPFSLIGGIAAVYCTGIGLSLGTLVGLVTVFGISARNAILLLSYYEEIVDVDHQPWSEETLILGANERLTPILMTAILTALGLAPLAFSFHQAGQEISGPMAITILGGLATSTILNLLLLPALAARFSGPASQKHF